MAETLEIDPTSEDSTNSAFALVDSTNGINVTDMAFPVPDKDLLLASSISTEGDRFVTSRPKNREITIKCRVWKSTHALLETKIGQLQQKIGKVQREGGTLKRVTLGGYTIVFDLIDADLELPLDWQYALSKNVEVTLRFVAMPYGRGAEQFADVSDDFSSDTIGSGAWTFDAGGGTLAVSGGQLVPSTTAAKRLYRSPTYYDAQGQIKFHTGASVASYAAGMIAKRLDASNYLLAQADAAAGGVLRLFKVVGGSATQLASTGYTLSTGTDYWLRFRVEGNKLTAELWTSAPAQAASPAASTSYTLSGAEATQFGVGVQGNSGLALTPQATDWRMDDYSLSPNAYYERTNPVLVTPPMYGVGGDVLANGRLVVNEEQAADQWTVLWGIQSRYLDTSASAALFWEAESLTAQGGSATAAGPSGASGSGSNVMRSAALATSYVATLSTQATGGGAHMSHIGDYRMFVRVQTPTTNTGAVSVALQWAEGDFRKWTPNAEIALPVGDWEGQWLLLDLGLVHLTKATAGTQRWEGRIVAKSTVAGDTIDIDHLFLLPVTEGAAQVQAVSQLTAPTSFSARDEFDQTAGNLNGKAAPIGGNWATSGSTTDLAVETTGHTAQRTTTSDSGGARVAVSGAASLTDVVVQVDLKASAMAATGSSAPAHRLFARYANAGADQLLAILNHTSGTFQLEIYKNVSSSLTALATVPAVLSPYEIGQWHTIRLYADSRGAWAVWLYAQGASPGNPVAIGRDAVLATGGALATGSVGFSDENASSTASTRNYDNFVAWVPTTDAAVFASQSLEVRSDRARREDSGGTLWVEPSDYEGSYLRLPPAGRESRTVRTLVKGVRGPQFADGVWADSAIDDISARHFPTPRYLVVPEA